MYSHQICGMSNSDVLKGKIKQEADKENMYVSGKGLSFFIEWWS